MKDFTYLLFYFANLVGKKDLTYGKEFNGLEIIYEYIWKYIQIKKYLLMNFN